MRARGFCHICLSMAVDDIKAAGEESDGPHSGWRPSLRPIHRMPPSAEGSRIVERVPPKGMLRSLLNAFSQPLVKVFLALSLLITAAIVVEAIVDDGWAQKEVKEKPIRRVR